MPNPANATAVEPVAGEPLLKVRNLTAGYSGRAVIYDVELDVNQKEVVVLLGSNGAGKTTTLNAIAGLVRPVSADVEYRGQKWRTDRPWRAASAGLAVIPAERITFAGLSVRENLILGAYTSSSTDERDRQLEMVLELFPILGEREKQKAGTMSGGQQRMLSLAIALMASPQLLFLDEPSLGLAPMIVQQLMAVLGKLVDQGISVLMVEQNVGQALALADRVYIMRSGRIIREMTADEARELDDWWDLF